jgi:hypothetical protein
MLNSLVWFMTRDRNFQATFLDFIYFGMPESGHCHSILGSKKSRPPRNIPRNGPLCSLPKTKKIISQIFKNQLCIGIFMSLCDQSPQFYHFIFLFLYFLLFYCFKIKICGENPAKYPRLSKNPPKYTTAYIVYQSNCRWHWEHSCFSS